MVYILFARVRHLLELFPRVQRPSKSSRQSGFYSINVFIPHGENCAKNPKKFEKPSSTCSAPLSAFVWQLHGTDLETSKFQLFCTDIQQWCWWCWAVKLAFRCLNSPLVHQHIKGSGKKSTYSQVLSNQELYLKSTEISYYEYLPLTLSNNIRLYFSQLLVIP